MVAPASQVSGSEAAPPGFPAPWMALEPRFVSAPELSPALTTLFEARGAARSAIEQYSAP